MEFSVADAVDALVQYKNMVNTQHPDLYMHLLLEILKHSLYYPDELMDWVAKEIASLVLDPSTDSPPPRCFYCHWYITPAGEIVDCDLCKRCTTYREPERWWESKLVRHRVGQCNRCHMKNVEVQQLPFHKYRCQNAAWRNYNYYNWKRSTVSSSSDS